MGRISRGWTIAVVVAGLVAIDQASKWWITSDLPLKGWLEVVPGVFYLVHLANTGAVNGIGEQVQGLVPVLAALTVALLALVYVLFRLYERMAGPSALTSVFLVCAVAPLVCTLIDRVRLGYVVDFVALRGLPVFNFADLLPAIAIVALLGDVAWYVVAARRPARLEPVEARR